MSLIESLRNLVPARVRSRVVRPVVHQVGSFLIDAGGRLLGHHTTEVPPARVFNGGPTIYIGSGFEYFGHFKTIGRLKPTDDVLDIGCAAGRIAVPLFNYLQGGSYTGIDVIEAGVKWAGEHITARHPNFRFIHADVYNERYNPGGTQKGSEYRFPFSNGSFDFVFLGSVFTHLLEEDAAHYLKEIARLLRPGGRVFGTWLLLNDEARALIGRGQGSIALVHRWRDSDDVLVADPDLPEAAIGFSDEKVRSMHTATGLRVEDPIHRGAWCGRSDYLTFQDVVLGVKP